MVEKHRAVPPFLFSIMNKKEYQRPNVKVVLLESNSILAGSTGATGEDVPWAAKRIIDEEWDEEWDEE